MKGLKIPSELHTNIGNVGECGRGGNHFSFAHAYAQVDPTSCERQSGVHLGWGGRDLEDSSSFD
jgi:hypothetical protein